MKHDGQSQALRETGYALAELSGNVNRWCEKAGVKPANGQVGAAITERNIRFYRTIGLLDPPSDGGGRGYAEKHLLQLIALRVLQAQGLPLRRIRELLFGRSLSELREIRDRGRAELMRSTPLVPSLVPGETWQLVPVKDGFALLCRGTRVPSPEQIRKVRQVLEG